MTLRANQPGARQNIWLFFFLFLGFEEIVMELIANTSVPLCCTVNEYEVKNFNFQE